MKGGQIKWIGLVYCAPVSQHFHQDCLTYLQVNSSSESSIIEYMYSVIYGRMKLAFILDDATETSDY